jgi:hypothetical protein
MGAVYIGLVIAASPHSCPSPYNGEGIVLIEIKRHKIFGKSNFPLETRTRFLD